MNKENHQPIGYTWLTSRFQAETLPWWIQSFTGVGHRQSQELNGRVSEFYRNDRSLPDEPLPHLLFAVNHEGIHLELLRKILPQIDPSTLAALLTDKPLSRYGRILWLLYEHFSGQQLTVPDLKKGGYISLLDPDQFYTSSGVRSKRHRVVINLIGTLDFAPIVRRTPLLRHQETDDLSSRISELIGTFPPEILQRAVRYFFTKESKSTFEIEREKPSQEKGRRFLSLLENIRDFGEINEKSLTALQHEIVDPRFANEGYRDLIDEQIYIGQTIAPGTEKVHFIGPKPNDVRPLMDAFTEMANTVLLEEPIPPVVAAGIASFGFDFLHPFSDGNGRIHRFLIHSILEKRGFNPDGIILPISATMLNRMPDYDAALETFSRPLMEKIDYEIDWNGKLTVSNDTIDFYRYIDLTPIVETLYSFLSETIEKELPAELRYLTSYDKARQGLANIVDLPNRPADLFIQQVRQNEGTLSNNKRKQIREFQVLSEEEIKEMESSVRVAFASSPPESL